MFVRIYLSRALSTQPCIARPVLALLPIALEGGDVAMRGAGLNAISATYDGLRAIGQRDM